MEDKVIMSKKLVLALFIFLLPITAFSKDLSVSWVAKHEEWSYRTLLKRTGKVIWQADLNMERMTKDNQAVVRMAEKGFGNYNNSPDAISWEMEAFFAIENPPLFMEITRIAKSDNGRELWRKSKFFDPAKGQITVKQSVSGELPEEKTIFSSKRPVFPADILVAVLRGYDFESRETFEFYILSSQASLYKISSRAVKKEMVTVPAGSFECYRMDLTPDLGVLNLALKPFLPKTYVWFTAAKPYVWIKYEGLESGLNSPYVVMELIRFKDGDLDLAGQSGSRVQ